MNLFQVLMELDRRNFDVFKELAVDEETLKELINLSGWMLPLWMTGSSNPNDERELVHEFDTFNDIWDSTYGHPELRVKLLASCGSGISSPHRYVKRASAKYNSKVFELLRLWIPDIKIEEVELWCRKSTEENVRELAQLCGFQDKEIPPIIKAFQGIKEEQS